MSLTLRDSFAPWSLTPEAVVHELKSDAKQGLSSSEAAARLAQFGRNELPEATPDPLWLRYWRQLTGDAVVRLLLIGAIVSLALQDYLEGGAILVMLNIMAGFGLWQEGRATDAARSLRSTDEPLKLVIRDGVRKEIPVAEVVPGDIVYLPTGAIPPADGRAIAAVNAEKADAALTGEGPKSVKLPIVDANTVVNSQDNMLFRGCPIVAGNVTMVVTSTGSKTRIGRIAEGLAGAKEMRTPLDDQLDDLGDTMARLFIWVAAAVIAVGLGWKIKGYFEPDAVVGVQTVLEDLKESFITAVALIIAAIPEGLPAVLTITLAIATKVMVKRQALVRRPKAVEGGGSMTVLLTDKTGTLTANQMESQYLYINGDIHEVGNGKAPPEGGEALQRAMQVAAFCNNTSGSTELALARWVEQVGFSGHGDVQSREVEHVFDQGLKRMTTVHQTHSGKDSGVHQGRTRTGTRSLHIDPRRWPRPVDHRRRPKFGGVCHQGTGQPRTASPGSCRPPGDRHARSVARGSRNQPHLRGADRDHGPAARRRARSRARTYSGRHSHRDGHRRQSFNRVSCCEDGGHHRARHALWRCRHHRGRTASTRCSDAGLPGEAAHRARLRASDSRT